VILFREQRGILYVQRPWNRGAICITGRWILTWLSDCTSGPQVLVGYIYRKNKKYALMYGCDLAAQGDGHVRRIYVFIGSIHLAGALAGSPGIRDFLGGAGVLAPVFFPPRVVVGRVVHQTATGMARVGRSRL